MKIQEKRFLEKKCDFRTKMTFSKKMKFCEGIEVLEKNENLGKQMKYLKNK